MVMARSDDNDVWSQSYDGVYNLYAQAKKGANFALQTRSRRLISMVVLILLPFLAPLVIVFMLIGGVFLAPLLCGVTAYYALFHFVSLSSIIKWCDSSKYIDNQVEEVLSTTTREEIGQESPEESNDFEGVQKKDEEQAVQENDTAERSIDDSTVEAEGEVAEYNVFHFDDRVKGQREGSEEADAIKEATDEPVQVPSENKHSVEEEEDKPEELNRVEEESAGASSASEKSTVCEEPEIFTYKMAVEETQVGHPEGRSSAPINEEKGVDEKEAPYKKAVVEGKEAPGVEDAVAEKPVGSLEPYSIEGEVDAPVTELSVEEPAAQEVEASIAEPEEVEQTKTEAYSVVVSEGPLEEQEAEAQSEPNQSEEKLKAKRQGSKARKRRQDKMKK
ncbi:uncharacterized protein [Physcomitrium patens]|uniref:Uncharacterized protein n=1 Tax=Physcomitrium patens TaxID=3218 RepID=A0A2K1IAN3_PHYPA|nr:uncharacterized protein LOC112278497 [Physcomitrium patens]XP_024367836.1 uncharacterized protein LOC112278497 [Physcomitrium patens]XP_024367837.1 uncharacterized protein LOC112278497 [Physcomitrium patens]XP_024367838.1 uncharacterized protein LOC112278497 [Physcomitrium patens]XP_024367839.1 uncharacterized protein LOC112278497 [Physcomitrium patens]PNR26341.1 hypothetical protein PHYPA_030916 [Physcomitrium patens]|eukprot:XP_024367835.1 uncharacterized protein LOC112278497 [Physcomitrella patens]